MARARFRPRAMRWTAIPILSSAATAKSLAQIPRSCSAQPTLRVLLCRLFECSEWQISLTEIQHISGMTAAALPEWLLLDRNQADLIDYDVFASIYNAGKLALLASWHDRPSAEKFSPLVCAGVRHRVVRVVRDYGMFDRR